MKKAILFYLLLITTISIAQERIITGIIKDANTKLPINRVSVSIVGTNMGTVSNEEGEFRITVPESYSKLSFNHLSYDLIEYDIKENSKIEIVLIQKVYHLNEVVINKNEEDRHKAENMLREAIAATKKKTDKTVFMHTYYREINKIDGQYTSFCDGLLDFYSHFKNEKRNHNRIKSDLFIKQSRVFDLRNFLQKDKAPSLNDVQNEVASAYSLDDLEFGILKHPKKYIFQIETKTDDNGNNIDIIHINAKEGVEEFLEVGSITCDSKTKLILDIDLKLEPELQKYSKMGIDIVSTKFKFNDWSRKSSFRIEGDKYILINSRIRCNKYLKIGKNFDNNFETVSDLTVLDYEEGEFNYDKPQNNQKWLLFQYGNSYTDEFWKKQNVIYLSEAEENMIETLNQKSAPTSQSTVE